MTTQQLYANIRIMNIPLRKKLTDKFEAFSRFMIPIYRWSASAITRLIYRIDYINFEKIPKNGPVLIIANHISYVDGLIIQAACKRPVRFLIDEFIYYTPIANYFLRLNGAIPVLPKKENVTKALETISSALENNEIVCIFPEGQLTYTGHLGRFKPGIEWVIERDPVPIYPVAIRGLWGSIFSRKYRKAKYRWIPRSFRRNIKIICGDEIHPENAEINFLQRQVLALRNAIA